MNILVTNDDGYDSPLFHFLLEELHGVGNINVVVPAEEQSWTGKSMSRFDELRVSKVKILDEEVTCFSGKPADCVNFGVYEFMEEKPDLVISGINVGFNCGVSFILSSGTVGACLEANIAGIPALSLSRRMAPQTYQRWSKERCFTEEETVLLKEEVKAVMSKLKETLFVRDDFLTSPVTWQVEMPQELNDNWELESGVLGHSFYGGLFSKADDEVYKHSLKPFESDPRPNADINIIDRGNVSLAKLDIRQIGQEPVEI